MRRAYYVIPLLILFAAMTSGCGETAGPVKSPGVKPGSGRDALVKRTADKDVGNKATASKDTAAKKNAPAAAETRRGTAQSSSREARSDRSAPTRRSDCPPTG